MTREEFLKELRISLQGRIPQSQVNEHLTYYENYIIEESRKGRTEEEVIADIGSPRLVAKTLASLCEEEMDQSAEYDRSEEKKGSGRVRFPFHTWYGRILAGIAAVFILLFFVKIGMILLPMAASVVLILGILYVIFLVFFGKK